MSDAGNIFQVKGITVAYGKKKAVSDLTFELGRGQCLGLLGANGAGKTSTIRVILDLMKSQRGVVSIFGTVPRKCYGKIGYVPEETELPGFLNGVEYLILMGRIRAKSTSSKEFVLDLLSWFDLDPQKRISQYSKGMKKRLALAQAFVGGPELLILDEPLTGLDPLIIKKLRDKLQQYLKEGVGILFSSHILAEVEKICTHIVILQRGEKVGSGPIGDFLSRYSSIEGAFSHLAGGGNAFPIPD